MNCTRAQDLLQFYLDGRLGLARIRALERHLASCQACRAELILLEDVVAGVHSLSAITEPDWLAGAIMQRIARTTAQPPRELPADLRVHARRMRRQPAFRLSARDVLLALTLATLVTLSFILLQPGLRNDVLSSSDPVLAPVLDGLHTLGALVNGNLIGWIGWGLSILLGIAITLFLVGSEVRAGWRQRVRERLEQQHWW